MQLLKVLPKKYLSWFIGSLAHIPLPKPLNTVSTNIFARAYGIDVNAATEPLSSFSSIGAFFIRDMKPELRPIQGAVVSPVDGTLRRTELVKDDGFLTQVKGQHYSVARLLGEGADSKDHNESAFANRFVGGRAWSFYLSPRDAHHIHSPVDGEIIFTRHIPGALWPVNDWAIKNVPELFAVNERIVTVIQSSQGLMAVVMVGATNVGKIELPYYPLTTNKRPWEKKPIFEVIHSPPLPVVRGQKIGTFHMGSSVVLLCERQINDGMFSDENAFGVPVRYGQDLVALCGNFVP